MLKHSVCVWLLFSCLAYCAPRPKHRLSLQSSLNFSPNLLRSLFSLFTRARTTSVGFSIEPQKVVQVRTLTSILVFQSISPPPQSNPAAADVSAALSPQLLPTGRTDLLPDKTHTYTWTGCYNVLCWKHKELQMRVASRSNIGEDLARWWIGASKKYKNADCRGSVESRSSSSHHTNPH